MKKFLIFPIFILPTLSFAVSFADLSKNIYNTYLTLTVNILTGLALLFFFYSIFKLMLAKSSGADKEGAKSNLLWSIIALFIMFSFWGLIKITKESFDFNDSYQIRNINFGDYKPETPGFKIK